VPVAARAARVVRMVRGMARFPFSVVARRVRALDPRPASLLGQGYSPATFCA